LIYKEKSILKIENKTIYHKAIYLELFL
jgi:hypothetical protein